MKLVIGNKNDSSWSMRPWVLMRHFGIAFDEVTLRFDVRPGSAFDRELARDTPTAKVPRCSSTTTASRCGTRWPSSRRWPSASLGTRSGPPT
jgi:glutathione S-transferase